MDPHSMPPPPDTYVTAIPGPYRCPGEPDEISLGVHLSRLSSFYHKCRQCVHRSDIARLAPSLQNQWQQMLLAPEAQSLFQGNGVRGLFLNQLTRNEATQLAAAFASTLQEVAEIWRSRHSRPLATGLRVVFGHDDRPSSPELAIAAATTLRQHGCELIDLGWSLRPQLDRALRSTGADGAFFVTGHGSPVGWNGFDLIGPDGIVWSSEGVLNLVAQRFHQPCPRPNRLAATLTTHDAMPETLAQLHRDLHGLRPLRVAITAEEPIQLQLLTACQSDWPGILTLISRSKSPLASDIPLLNTLAEDHSEGGPKASTSLRLDRRPDITFHLGEDARQCSVFDEAGQRVSQPRLLFALGELLLSEHPHVDVVLSDELFDRYGWAVERCGPGYLVFHRGGQTEEQLIRTMHALDSSLALDGAERYWIRHEGHTRCEAIFTATQILRSLSRTDGTASEWALSGIPCQVGDVAP